MASRRVRDPGQLSGPSIRDVRVSYVEDQYPTFVRNNLLRNSDLARLRSEVANFGYAPLVSLLLPVPIAEAGLLERTLDSILGQAYPNWELRVCVADGVGEALSKILSRYEQLDGRVGVAYPGKGDGAAGLAGAALSLAEGEFAGFLGPGDELAPDALFRIIEALQGNGEYDLIYTDEDEIDEAGVRSNPRFKPDWSPNLLLSDDYVSRLSVYRRTFLEEVGGVREDFEGHHDYDLVLRAAEQTARIHHVPRVMYHRRKQADPTSVGEDSGHDKARRALSEALARRDLKGSVEDGILPGQLRVRLEVRDDPKVSIIIPTRDNVALLRNCVESVERLTSYRNYEIVIMDNDSVDPETVEYLGSTRHRVIPFREKFNYSRINNAGVSRAAGEYVLLLNDDTEVTSGGWLGEMLGHAQRLEVGAVGAKLVYPDGRIQHAGVLTGVGGSYGPGVATHAYQFYPSDHPGHLGTAARVTDYGAVTAACVLLRKAVFEEVGGFDEENLSVSFNDVDLCLRIRERGYSVVYTPYAELVHHESVSRGYKGDPAEALYMRERWGDVLDAEPFYNLHFSRGSGDFNLRADLLRPGVLQRESERAWGGSESTYKNALTAGQEELLGYLRSQQRVARDSGRTALVPANGNKGIKIPSRESLAPDGGPGTARPGRTPSRDESGPIRTDQFVWMFGSPRTGSTWLSRMMAELDNQERWHEPYVGLLFGSFVYERLGNNTKLLNSPAFIMGAPYRRVWLNSIRNFLLEGARARYPNLRRDQHLVIKEPNGSVGAPLLLEATPESRLIFLIRDPRDVVASRLDAFSKDSWSAQDRNLDSAERLNAFTEQLAEDYLNVVSQVRRVYETHPGEKTLVRYEDLRKDTVGTLRSMYDALKINVEQDSLEAAAAKHAWEQVPEDKKGAGKFYRKAKPGGWEEDLSPEQVRIIEDATGAVLSEFYRADRPV